MNLEILRIILFLSPTIPLYYIVYVQWGLGYAVLTMIGILGLWLFLAILLREPEKENKIEN